MRQTLIDWYRDYTQSLQTYEKFAECHGVSYQQIIAIIGIGRQLAMEPNPQKPEPRQQHE